MKKITSVCIPPLQTNFTKKILLTLIIIITGSVYSFAISYTSTSATNTAWNVATNWSPNGIPTAADDVTINSSIDITNATGSCLNLTINSGKTFSMVNNGTLSIGTAGIAGGTMTNNGTFSANTNGNTINITLNGLTSAWINNGTYSSSNTNNTVIMNGPGSYIGGTNASSFSNLTVNPGTSNIVSLTNNISVQGGGTLKLQSGYFKLGSSQLTTVKDITINLVNGNFANSQDGLGDTDADGGTIVMTTSPPGTVNFTGLAPILNNVTVNTNTTINFPSTGGVNPRVNGIYNVLDGNAYSSTGNTVIWGPISKLNYTTNGGTFKLFGASGGTTASTNLWLPMSSGTIGVTPGYPNDVSITAIGSSQGGNNNSNGWVPGAMNLAIDGTFTIGVSGGATNGQVDFSNLSSFSAKNLVINKNSRLTLPKATTTLTGDFTDNTGGQSSGSVGLFVNGTSTVKFSGGGTSNFSAPGKTDVLDNITVTNGTYVKLNSPVTTDATGNLTFGTGGGYVGTTTTNILNVTNTTIVSNTATAVSGGGPTAYVDGPLQWSIPANGGGVNYTYPVGDKSHNGGAYLPLIFTTPSMASANSVTATAFNTDPAGTFNTPITSISNTEYWSLSATSAITGGKVDVTRPAPISPFKALATSPTASGTYSTIGGSPVSGTEIGGGTLTANNPAFIVMAAVIPVPLTVEREGGNTNLDASCSPIPNSGTLIVGGVGGTGPYKYSMTSATGPWVTNPTFTGLSVGNYSVWVMDAATPTPTVATATLPVLGPLQINGNNADITFCSIQPVTLTATNGQNPNATYLWSPGGQTTASITVTPTAATTYMVTSTVPFTGGNLLTNGGFDGGNPAGFVADYASPPSTGYGTTPGNGAYYLVSSAATNLCTNFTNPPGGPENGSSYFIADGGVTPGDIFHLNLTSAMGLTPNTTYTFSYWYVRGSVSAPFTPIETRIGATVLGTVVASNTSWAQASYSITTDASGNATITLKNTSPTTSTNGNDFLIDNLEIKLLTTCTVTASIKVNIDCSSLPVELVKFNAVKQGAGALVTWTTASEKNSSYYIIEKSTDGINFSAAGKVEANGNSSSIQNYSFVDPSISTGTTYYKLIEYDVNGASQQSAIKAVSKDGVSSVQVVPNPNNGTFVIAISGNDKSRVTILNSLGQIVYSNESTESLRNVDISALASGVYYLQVSTSEDAIAQKIVKE